MPPRKVHFTKTWSSKHKLKRVWTSLVIMFKLPQKSARFVFVKKAHTVELSFTIFDLKVKVKCGQVWWPILWIFALHLTHPNAHTHHEHTQILNTHEHTQIHTVNTHTEQWAAIYAAAPGEQIGTLLKGLTSVVVLKVERALYIPPPTFGL